MSKPRIGIVVSTSDPHLESAARAMLDELAGWAQALKRPVQRLISWSRSTLE